MGEAFFLKLLFYLFSMSLERFPELLSVVKELLFDSLGYEINNFILDDQGKEYSACEFQFSDLKVVFRAAKVTPTKVGQFVTLWKRNKNGVTQPFDATDPYDFAIIAVRSGERFGLFVFSKQVLIQQGILTTQIRQGKRGFRIYPPWDLAPNKQAQKTQEWQLNYFFEINSDNPVDLERMKLLGSLNC
ncbi:MepB family protein [Flavobacterium sp. SM15]|uniref:MepB family protein n=1 Tax=Flavobacterium sp. SM15 TaxID=2908005 RepID=UPI001EDC8108|nr:MepB family protein [Flavobacterium sp. SM15]MCG2610833.1 MepB family protein [Flavobacterium sp. SM15]